MRTDTRLYPGARDNRSKRCNGSFERTGVGKYMLIGYLLLLGPLSCDKTLLELLHNSVFGLGMGPYLSQHDNLRLAEGHKSL